MSRIPSIVSQMSLKEQVAQSIFRFLKMWSRVREILSFIAIRLI